MTDRRYGPDGLGPEPSPEVVKIRDQFFDDDNPPPTDPALAEKIREGLAKRVPVWRKNYGRK